VNWDQMKGKWKQYKGQIKAKWGKLTDDDLQLIDGRREELIGRLQQRYGIAKEAADKQVEEFMKALQPEEPTTEKTRRAGQN
jgi:uncharacterized protein YjbJ (UPF0337 family)